MADELPSPPETGSVATDAAAAGQPVPPAQPQLGGDSKLAAILAKQAAGETLTHKERGYLGSIKRRSKPKAAAAPASDNVLFEAEQPDSPSRAAAGEAAAENPLFAPAVQDQAPADSFNLSVADSAVIQAAAEAILDSMDTTTKMYIGYEARKAGADEQTVKAYETAVALNVRNRDLMAKNSEPVILALCKFFRCQPAQLAGVLKNSAFMCGLFAHVTAVTATVKSIRQSVKERSQQTA